MAGLAMIALGLEKTGRRLRVPMFAVVVVAVWALLIVLFNVLVVEAGHAATPCVFKNVTGGVPCPTCGSTRAAMDLSRGDVLSALWRNPFVLIAEVLVLGWVGVRLATGYSVVLNATRREKQLLWAGAAVLFLANWVHVIAIDGPWERETASVGGGGALNADALLISGENTEGEAISAPPTGG